MHMSVLKISFYMFGLRTVFFLQIQVTHVFVLQPLLGHLVWGEPAM